MTTNGRLCPIGRILRLDSRTGADWLKLDAKRGASKRLRLTLEESTKDCIWILTDQPSIERLLDAIHDLLASGCAPSTLGSLITLAPPMPNALGVLQALFDPVVGGAPSFEHLALDELLEVVRAPDDTARDLILGGTAHQGSKLLALIRGNLQTLVVPFSLFTPTPKAKPAFRKLAFDDHGHTIRLGKYEASADSILYELDPDYRRRANAKRHATDQGFGPALRRLRKQRGLSRLDFPGLSEKTLARIERGEVERPHPRTIRALEKRLGMTREQIASY